ncbi:MAG: GGDEF domain-containing protein [Steroidobacteraceae bacterium]
MHDPHADSMKRPSQHERKGSAAITVKSLNLEAQALRQEVLTLKQTAEDLRRDSGADSDRILIEANERLVLAALHADRIAETAVENLHEATMAGQRDPLTDIANRALMLDRLEHAITVARRHVSLIAVLFIDLDDFKQINDTLGHTVGDETLNAVARRLESVVRASDTVSRYGGDEFVVLLAELTHSYAAAVIAKKMLAALAAPMRVGTQLLSLSASVGIAIFPDDGDNASILIHSADSAMYRSKRRMRGHFGFHKDSADGDQPPELRLAAASPGATPQIVPPHPDQRGMHPAGTTSAVFAELAPAPIHEVTTAAEQLALQARVSKELRSSLTSSATAKELLDQVHTDEPLLQLLIEREVAHISTPAYRSYTSPRIHSVQLLRNETKKTGEFIAVGPDGTLYTVLEFTVTARSGMLDQTRRELTQKSFGLDTGERVTCVNLTDFQIEHMGITLKRC